MQLETRGQTECSPSYDGAHHVLTRTDAKQHVTGYTLDAYGRLTSVAHYAQGLSNSADPNLQVNYYYDSYSDPIATNTRGRLAAVTLGNLCQQTLAATGYFSVTCHPGGAARRRWGNFRG